MKMIVMVIIRVKRKINIMEMIMKMKIKIIMVMIMVIVRVKIMYIGVLMRLVSITPVILNLINYPRLKLIELMIIIKIMM